MRERQRRPDERRLAVDELAAVERAVDRPAHRRDEEPETEQTEHDRRNAGEVGDADADDARELGIRRRVLGQIDCRRDAGRHRRDRHEQRQRDGAEDGGKDAALGHAIARRRRDELPREDLDAADDDVDQDDARASRG